LGALAVLRCSTAIAADYPDRNITMVVPFAPGGTIDIVARLVGEHMGKTLGRSIVVENDSGAGGTVASRRVAQAAADGYTLMIGTLGTHGAAPSQYPNLKYDPRRDFTPIGQTSGMPFVLVTRKDFPVNNLKEFVEYVQRNQDKVSEAHAGVGSEIHAACTLLQSIIGTKTARVAYRGGAPAINDLVAGQVDFACTVLATVAPHVQAGSLKALAVTGPERVDVLKDIPTTTEAGLPAFQATLKDIPTTTEAGLPAFQATTWTAMFAPKHLPEAIQSKLIDALTKALDDATTRKRLIELGAQIPDSAHRTPQALQMLVEREVARWAPVLKAQETPAK
jgi:tripartite-type tricarboxylate transporter receptor subunit TctC